MIHAATSTEVSPCKRQALPADFDGEDGTASIVLLVGDKSRLRIPATKDGTASIGQPLLAATALQRSEPATHYRYAGLFITELD
jgi:hypothetical protein